MNFITGSIGQTKHNSETEKIKGKDLFDKMGLEETKHWNALYLAEK